MHGDNPTRREFLQAGAAVAAGMTLMAGAQRTCEAQSGDMEQIRRTRSFNPEMEYRRLGKTGIWVSAVCMGGHWKRIDKYIGGSNINPYGLPGQQHRTAFDQNRWDVVSRCIERGINLIDACTGGEVMAYSRALKGRREAMFLGYSWFEKEMRFAQWRTCDKLLQSLDEGLKAAELEYVDLWRITCHEKGGNHTAGEAEEMIKALDKARKAGKCRFTGFSSHDRPWIKMMIEKYPDVVQVVVTPYAATSKELPTDSVFAAVRQCDAGVLGIKPFGSNSLFKGDSSPDSPEKEADDRRARLAIRNILCNPAITAPIPGLISPAQVDNVALAIKERRENDMLTPAEKAELDAAGREMWARLPRDYQWLRDWQYV